MTVTSNFLVGSSVQYDKSLLYDTITNGKCYIGFARETPSWGLSVLVKIKHRSGPTWPTNIIGQSGDGLTNTRKFYDDNSFRLLSTADEPVSGQRVYVRRILKANDVNIVRSRTSPTNTSTSSNKLVDSSANFTTATSGDATAAEEAVSIGDTIQNVTDGSFAIITAIDSTTQLSISNDIFTSTGKTYKIFTSDASKYTTVECGNIELKYMNEEWVRIEGLNYDLLKIEMDTYTPDLYNYYLFNYQITEVTSRVRIEDVRTISRDTIQTNVRLMYSTVTNATVPTTDFGNNLIGDLRRNINVLGEVSITGLNPKFVTEGAGYIIDNSLTGATFFLTTNEGVVIQDDMAYVETVENNNEVSLVFSYPLVNEAVTNSGRLKISVTRNVNKLAIFNERFVDGQYVTDSNPPPLQVNYLKQGSIHSSILDVLGLVRIDAADVKFAKRIDNTTTQKQIFGDTENLSEYPVVLSDTLANKDVITINNQVETEVTYAYTTDKDIAKNYYFDLLRINKTISSSTGTGKVYRQLFICYNPQIANGGEGGLATDATGTSYSTDTSNEIFIEGTHKYDLGTILYIANKSPIFREHLSSSESFTIFI